MKIVTIIGARPQFIKAASVSKVFRKKGIEEFILHTGQHYDSEMSGIFFKELDLKSPDLNLHIHGGLHGQQTGRMLEAIENVLLQEKPDRVLVYGDTNSTLAGALAASKLHIPLDHVEAGMRCFNKKTPEEVNRVLTDHLSTLLFSPTTTATYNLKQEGLGEDHIKEVGDVMYDAVLHFKPLAAAKEESILDLLKLQKKSYYLATIHRAENTNTPKLLIEIFRAFETLSKDVPIVLPLHPRTKEKIESLNITTKNITIINPVGYLDMLWLTHYASLVLTDSGGLQKESYFAGVPCLTLRDETEWIELIEAGWNKLIPVTKNLTDVLPVYVNEMITNTPKGQLFLYGKGDASEKIVDCIISQ
ncbi:MAG: UDP-N-acetylglucosamine 2-epimerase (non-hydrolyzing) [Alphaproteobacteria bacterium]|nr:UDP-N-acetylglucosamine 2-epimerase (non-hydrolyzing) [Alphaproteobacteria bacterium]